MTTERVYPIPRPANGQDPRFCLGLTYDIGKILTAYGYPPINSNDFTYWQQRLFTTIYQEKP